MQIVEQAWDHFRDSVISPNAQPVQIEEMRRAFYSGVYSLYRILMEEVGSSKSTEESGVGMMAALEAELHQFADAQIIRDRDRVNAEQAKRSEARPHYPASADAENDL